MSLSSLFFGIFMLFIHYRKKRSSVCKPGFNGVQALGSPCARPYLGPCPAPGSPGNLLPLITLPQTPRPTLKLSWLKPRRSSTPGSGSPAVPCRLSGTSPRWPSACAAGSPPKPEPRPRPRPTARPWLRPGLSVPASLLSQKGQSRASPFLFLLPPAHSLAPSPGGQDQSVWGMGRGQAERESIRGGL